MKREGWQQGTVRINRSKKLLRVAAAAANCDDEAAVVAVAGAMAHGINRSKLLRVAAAAAAANCDETAVVAGAMAHGTKAPVVKPTNASKTTTGKCRRPRCASCHHHPVSKARDKAKGAHKLRACDVALNHRLVSWRVVDGGAGHGAGIPHYKGTSASSLLAYLAGSGSSWHEDEEDGGSAPLVNGGRLPDLYDIIVGRRAMLGRPEADPARATAIDDTMLGRPEADPALAAGDTDADAIEEQEQGSDEDGDDEENMSFCMVPITITVEFSDGEEDWIVVEEI